MSCVKLLDKTQINKLLRVYEQYKQIYVCMCACLSLLGNHAYEELGYISFQLPMTMLYIFYINKTWFAIV